jgi:DnaD/phage-associated family protein
MSGLVMGLVWELPFSSEFTAEDKFILLAYADHAWQDGTHAYPSIGLIAQKTGYYERTIQRHVRNLEKLGLLIETGKGQHGTTMYSFPLKKKPDGSLFLEYGGCQCDTPVTETPVSLVTPEEMTPEPKVVVKSSSASTTAPIKPNVFTAFENNIGAITPFAADELKDLEDTYSEAWVIAAISEAVMANARSLKYIQAILRRWSEEGFKTPKKPIQSAIRGGPRKRNTASEVQNALSEWLAEREAANGVPV